MTTADAWHHLLLMQADYALSRLVTLKDRTEATESLAKMHLAQRRNELVSFDLMLTVISTNVSFFGGVAAICGMNLWLAGSGAPKASHVLYKWLPDPFALSGSFAIETMLDNLCNHAAAFCIEFQLKADRCFKS